MNGFSKLIARLFGKKQTLHLARRPTKEEINALPFFEALSLERVVEVDSAEAAARAFTHLSRESVVGFDTESRPTFLKGEVSTGPHVIQFATLKNTFVFVLHNAECRQIAKDLIASKKLMKVGFGLDSDRRQIPRRLKIRPQSLVDLETHFRKKGYGRGVGVKAGVAIVFNRRFSKPKSATTSNWGRRRLTPAQLLYAANDAYAALRVYLALQS